jgi:hypothetical protein
VCALVYVCVCVCVCVRACDGATGKCMDDGTTEKRLANARDVQAGQGSAEASDWDLNKLSTRGNKALHLLCPVKNS